MLLLTFFCPHSNPVQALMMKPKTKNQVVPILTNTSLMILRLIGKYFHLMQMLEPIASDVFSSMTQLLDFYVLTIYKHFTRDLVRFSAFHYLSTT